MGFQDLVLLPSGVSFYNTFLKNVVGVKASGQPHVTKLFGGKQGHTPCKILLLEQILIFVLVEFH